MGIKNSLKALPLWAYPGKMTCESMIWPTGGHVQKLLQKEVTMPLQGKHALITGSSRGIGRGIALKLAEQRVNIAVHYHTQVDAAKETLAQVKAHGARAV